MEAVSILMPAYNAGTYIREAIDSVLDQTYSSWELVIVNDGSTDDTEQIVLSYTDARIRYEKNETNKGLVYTRNRLLNLARYDLLAFLDSDDIASRDRIAIQVSYLNNHPDISLVAGSLYGLQDGKTDKKSFVFDLSAPELPAHLLFHNPVSTSSVMFRKNTLPEELFRDNYPPVEDYDLWTRVLYSQKGVVLKNVLGYYRLHAQSISKQQAAASYANRNQVVLNQLEHYFNGNMTPGEKQVHLGLADFSLGNKPEDITALKDWIGKLLGLNERFQCFDQRVLCQVLYERVLKKFLRLNTYHYNVFRELRQLKKTLNPALNVELRRKELAILAFCMAGKKFISTN